MIDANPNITQSEIGRIFDIASANMAQLISRLADRELVECQPVDGRSHGLDLTSKGRTITRRVKKAIESYEEELLAKISPGKRAAFMAAFRTFWNEE